MDSSEDKSDSRAQAFLAVKPTDALNMFSRPLDEEHYVAFHAVFVFIYFFLSHNTDGLLSRLWRAMWLR